jgi:Peptidase U49
MSDKDLEVDPLQPIEPDSIDRIILASAPERETDWKELCARYKPSFHLLPDNTGVTLQARGTNVELDSKTLAWIWLLGFAAWRAFCLYGPNLLLRSTDETLFKDRVRSADPNYLEAEAAYDTILYVTRDLPKVEYLNESAGWPAGVPHRQSDKAGFDIQQQAAFDLTMIATAYMLLHEMRHIMFNVDDTLLSPPEEEMACDQFARDFILDNVDCYVMKSGEPVDRVLMKRAAGIALGAYIVHEFTPTQAIFGDVEHPPIADRLAALVARIPASVSGDFWVFMASLLVAIMKRRNASVCIPSGDGRDLCVALIEALRKDE